MLNGREYRTISDPLGRYYTSSQIGDILIDSMKAVEPDLILDLGSGSGVLSYAASKRWESANILSVDIDESASIGSKSFHSKFNPKSFQHHIADALGENLHQLLGVSKGSIDLSVCNPPYIRNKWKNEYWQILEDVGLSSYFNKSDSITADILFMAQNLRMLKSGGQLGLIVPDGLVAGSRLNKIRKYLIREHEIESCIELPRGAFRRTDAQAYILILNKNSKQSTNIKLKKVSEKGELVAEKYISPEEGAFRLDFSYWDNSKLDFINKQNQTRTFDGSISRGKYCSSEVKSSLNFIFHTSDFPKIKNANFKLKQHQTINNNSLENVMAMPGDILIARVGRNLQEKVCIVTEGSFPISDCVFRVRLTKGKTQDLKNFLLSDQGKLFLTSISSGVSAKHISKTALENALFGCKL